ncbi:MAG: ribulose-phosphate 3-epimerase [Ruminococcus sp.]|nr:ribulose-phosphate 3-epimerase [Ruminococcus sp.]
MSIEISASILGCDLSNIAGEIMRAELSGADCIHFDVMDGVFVNNISFGLPVLQSAKMKSGLPFDVHLMITKPEKYITRFAEAGADSITFHLEATDNVSECISLCRKSAVGVGISIKPTTPAEEVFPYLEVVDKVLVMTVEPGFGGQGFIEGTLDKIKKISQKIKELKTDTVVQVDGGINEKTAPLAVLSGATDLVAGTYLFKASDMPLAIKRLKESNHA